MSKKTAPKPEAKKVGRPSDYNEKIALEICQEIGTSSTPLEKLCKQYEHWPVPSTIFLWRLKHPEFSEMYATAKKHQAEVLVSEILQIADDSTFDEMITDDGQVKMNSEYLARSRLRVDTRKWIACKVLPKVYGDKITNEMTGPEGKPMQHEVDARVSLTTTEIDSRIAEMLGVK